MGYDICLFDLDGTLTDPKEGITKSFQYALSSFGIHEDLDNLTKFIGPPLRESFREYYGLTGEDEERVVVKYREYFSTAGIYQNKVYEGIPDLLMKLRQKDKILAVATSKLDTYACQILEYFELSEYFSFIAGDLLDGSRTRNGKVEVINWALDNLNKDRKLKTVMIGDRKHDIIGASQTSINSIGVTWGYGSIDELVSSGATTIIDSPDILYDIIVN